MSSIKAVAAAKQEINRRTSPRQMRRVPLSAPSVQYIAIEAPRGNFTPLEEAFVSEVSAVLALAAEYPDDTLFSIFYSDWRRCFQRLENGLGLTCVSDGPDGGTWRAKKAGAVNG